jgi:hypothetical protein
MGAGNGPGSTTEKSFDAFVQKYMPKGFFWGPVSCKSPWHSSCRAFSADTPQVLELAYISANNNKNLPPYFAGGDFISHHNKLSVGAD